MEFIAEYIRVPTHKVFSVITLTGTSLILCALIGFIINYGHVEQTRSEMEINNAINWQFENEGVVGIPSELANRYKLLMTNRAMESGQVRALVLGSSTAMGIRRFMFSDDLHAFNGAKNSNRLNHTIAEANYYIDSFPILRQIYINIDWGLGSPYQFSTIANYSAASAVPAPIHLWARIKDAVTFQRVKVVLSNVLSGLTTKGPIIYSCPGDDGFGIDILTPTHPQICSGFRSDGSATFAARSGIEQSRWNSLISDQGSHRYQEALKFSDGVIDPRYFKELSIIDRKLKERNGSLTLLLPPMLPKLVGYIEQRAEGDYLRRTIGDLVKFAQEHHIALVDASKSEDYGCTHNEFLDQHHAFQSCYLKVFQSLSN